MATSDDNTTIEFETKARALLPRLAEAMRQGDTYRNDVLQIVKSIAAIASGKVDDNAEELFWNVWHPASPQPLPEDEESTVLETLTELERWARIPYEPDAADSMDFSDASRYVHIAAAYALRLHARNQNYDDVSQTLNRIRQVLYHSDIRAFEPSLAGASDAPMGVVSFWGVSALALSALFRIKYLDGVYEDALKLAVEALEGFEAISFATDIEPEWLIEVGSIEEADLEDERAFRMKLGGYFPLLNLEPQEVVNVFEGLRLRNKAESWRLVAAYCNLLALTTDEVLADARILNGDGEEEHWDVYWHRAQGWAEAQLGQNELREYLRQEKEKASETRLKGYFFGEWWDKIQQRAQERLVNVDLLWFSEARIGLEAILNELQVAAETMCHAFIWEPLQQAKGGLDLLEFRQKDDDFQTRGWHPTLSNYAWVCRRPFFRAFVQDRGVSEDDQRFLASKLPSALDSLRKSREPAQHDPKKRSRRGGG